MATESSNTITDSTKLFSRYLSSEWTRRNTPQGLANAHELAGSAPKDDSVRIFLDAGFDVWLAFFLASLEVNGGTHYVGQRADIETFSAFQELPVVDRKAVATRVKNAEVHTTTRQKIDEIKRLLTRKRQRIDTSELPGSMSPSPSLSAAEPANEACPVQTGAPDSTTEAELPSPMFLFAISNSRNIQSDAPSVQTVSHPASKRINQLFPLYLRNAIRKSGDKAHISMTFTSNSSDCLLSLAIQPNKVQHVAWRLFRTNVETDNHFRYIVQEDGRRYIPRPEIALQGAEIADILGFCGDMVDRGIATSSVRIIEATEEIFVTSCMTLLVRANPDEVGFLNIHMGNKIAFRVFDILFR